VSVKIRLKRIGRKKQPTYRIVVIDSRSPRGGKVIESLGYYAPYLGDKPLKIDLDRVEHWRGQGAIATDAVVRLLRRFRKEAGDSGATEVRKKAEAPAPKPPKPEKVEAPVETPPEDAAPPEEETTEPAESAEESQSEETSEQE
jgi:small subunit ribosomal protein S16